MRRVLATIVTVLALVAAACGGDDSGGDAADDTAADDTAADVSTTAADGPTTTAGGDGDAESDDDTDGAADASTTTEAEVERTASWTGVTADEIAYGVVSIDVEALRDFGVELAFVPIQPAYDAWTAVVNEAGGVNGRMLRPVYAEYLPVGTDSADAACAVVTEDDPTFVVTGQFINDTPLCVTELHETPYVGHFGQTAERDARSIAPFVSIEMSFERQRVEGIRVMHDEGRFEGKNVALYWEAADRPIAENTIKPVFEELGVELVSEAEQPDFGGDTAAGNASLDVIIERFQADGVDLVVNISGVLPLTRAVDRTGADLELAFLNGQAADRFLWEGDQEIGDWSVLDQTFAVTSNKPSAAEIAEDAQTLECVEQYNAAGPEEPIDPATWDENTASGIMLHCRAFLLMVRLLTEAGPNPTVDTFREGLENLGGIDLPTMAGASFGPGKYDGGNDLRIYERVDPTQNFLAPVGDPILVD